MKSKKGVGFLLLAFCIALLCATSVKAIIIPLDDSGWAMIIYPDSQGVSIPIVERFDEQEVVIELGKTFDRPLEDGLFSPIIIEFQKISANASSNIVIRDEYIVNNTGAEWFDFHMYLMVDCFNPQAGFNPNFIPDGGQLEDVYYSQNDGYNGLPIELNFVDADGSGVPSSPPGDDVFWPGYANGQIVIATNPDMEVGDQGRFGLKQVPTIPEPITLALLGIGGLTTFTLKRRLNHSVLENKKAHTFLGKTNMTMNVFKKGTL